MSQLTVCNFRGDDLERLRQFASLRKALPYRFPEESYPPDATFFLVTSGSRPVARAAFVPNPHLPPEIGLFGFFEAWNDPSAAAMLFQALEEHARSLGKHRLVGPINGSTWNSYRVALPEGEPFLLDVCSQPYYCKLFEDNGFNTLAEYFSSKSELTAESFPTWQERHRLLMDGGYSIHSLDLLHAESQLREIHRLAVVAFRRNFLYTPISEQAFLEKYLPLVQKADPRFIFLLRDHAARLVGFHFAIANLLCVHSRELVQKTIAIADELRGKGIGSFLMEHCRRRAWENGYTSVYHALMHKDNISAKFNAARQRVVRQYKLYFREWA